MIWKVGMPNLGHTMERGRVQQWLKAPGDAVTKGECIALVESDKVSVEIEAPADGVLLRILVDAEADAVVGGTLALIGETRDAAAADRLVAELTGKPSDTPFGGTTTEATSERGASEEPAAPVVSASAPRRKATPLANRIARERSIDVSALRGSGPRGLIVKADVVRALEQTATAPKAAHPPSATAVPKRRGEPTTLSGMRARIAERMACIWREAPMVPLVATADVADALASPLTAARGLKINDLVLCACARALPRHGKLNAWLIDGKIERHSAVHLAFAVALDDGLVTPVIHDAGSRDPLALSSEARRLTLAARAGTLAPADFAGGTFTVSNLGGMGIDFFTPILNPPQVGILGVGQVRQEATLAAAGIIFRNVVSLCLVFDHRALDGADGARFLKDIRHLLGTPRELLAPAAVTREPEDSAI